MRGLIIIALALWASVAEAQTLNVKVGTFNVTTQAAGNTVAVTGVGFQPELILFSLSGRTTAGTNTGDSHLSVGAAASTSSRWAVGTASAGGAVISDAAFCQRDDALLCTVSPGGALGGLMDLQSMDSDGFTLIIDNDFPTDYLVTYQAFQGDLDVCLGRFTATGTAPVTQAVTNGTIACLASFTPTAVLFASTREASDPPTASAGAGRLALGAMTGSANEGTTYLTSADASDPSDTASYSFGAEVLSMGMVSAVQERAEFSSFDANGFTINWLERANASRIFIVAIKGVSARVENFLTRTDGNTISETGFGFQPKSVLTVSHGAAQSTQDTTQVNAQMSIGFGSQSGPADMSSTIWDEDNVGTTQVARATSTTELYVRFGTGETVVGSAAVQTWQSDGIDFAMLDNDPDAAFVWYLALGVTAAGGGTNAPRCLLVGAC